MRILACPGQGSQSEGFLGPWLAEFSGLRSRLLELSEAAGIDLIELGTEADEATIKDTANAQPLIVAASIAVAREVFGEDLASVDGVLGHSVGEFAAAALAGVISDRDALSLVSVRANAMAAASALEPTSMAAVIGLDIAAAEATAELAGLQIANFNGGGQFVVAGRKHAIEALAAAPPAGSRVIELKVAGAFHTDFMGAAVAPLTDAADGIKSQKPRLAIWSNKDGALVDSGSEVLARLVSQVASPVRFDLCLQSVASCSEFIELPLAGALAGLAKRQIPATALALRNPTDISKIGVK
jgi:[acyl-carrier-protein] S-malonyltransferase